MFVTHSVEEAVLLADRVVVMTAGPGRIDSQIKIELPRPRDVSSPEFNALAPGGDPPTNQPYRARPGGWSNRGFLT